MSDKDFKKNFSNNSNSEFNDKYYQEMEEKRKNQRTKIEGLLNEMKTKIEEGKSQYSSKKNSGLLLNNSNPMEIYNSNVPSMNINSRGVNMNYMNINNFNNNNYISNQSKDIGMNNNENESNINFEIERNNLDSENSENVSIKNSNNSNQTNKILDNNKIFNKNNISNIIDDQNDIKSIGNKDVIKSNSNLDDNSKNLKINQNNQMNSKLITPLNINNFDQEEMDNIRKSKIIDRHSEVYSSYYDYTPGETEGNLNELLEDINYFGEITKIDIEKNLKSNPNKYIPLEDALKDGNENKYFILGLLGKVLETQGCLVVIEKDEPKTKEENSEINTTLQFLVNNMYHFKKFIFHFDFGEKKNKELLENEDKRQYFNSQLKKKLLYKFNLNYNDILMTNPRKGSYQITAIIKKLNYNDYSPEKLMAELKEDIEFNDIKNVEKGILLSGCKLNPFMLDERGDNCDGGWGFNETRGNHPYYPPQGWIGYGLRVIDRFDKGNNAWIDYRNTEGEWSVAYHGVGSLLGSSELLNIINFFFMNNLQTGIRQQFKDSKDIYHEGEKVGEGVYVTPNPKVLEQYCGVFNYNGAKYKIGFMTRVKPEKIRCPEEEKDFWVINGTDNEIRPYRILMKEIEN